MNLIRIPVIIMFTILFTIGCKESQPQETQSAGALIVQLNGKVLTSNSMKNSIEKWNPVKMREVINSGIYIRTRKQSSCDILLANGSVIKIVENTILYVDKLLMTGTRSHKNKFKLEVGSILAKSSKLIDESSFSITTPTAVAGVRGTEFIVSHNKGQTRVAVLEGKVAVGRNISLDAQPSNENSKKIRQAAEELTLVNAGAAADVTLTDNRNIQETYKKSQQGQNVNVQQISASSRIETRPPNAGEQRLFVQFREIREMPAAEKAQYGVLLIIGGDSTEIFINGVSAGHEMLMRVAKVGSYQVKVVKNGRVIKEAVLEVKSKERTILKVEEPIFNAPETPEETQRSTEARENVFSENRASRSIDVFQEQQQQQINNVQQDLDSRARNIRNNEQTGAQRQAASNPDRSNYGTGNDVMNRLRQRTQNSGSRLNSGPRNSGANLNSSQDSLAPASGRQNLRRSTDGSLSE